MNGRTHDIVFTVFFEEEEYKIHTYEGEYRSLMHLIYDKMYTEDFGVCKGMGKCGTCLVEVSGLKGASVLMEEDEKSRIRKQDIKNENARLACQILISKDLENVNVRILQHMN
jgi:2Fe-2S ferredoxin